MKKILIIEDNPDAQEIYYDILSGNGYQCFLSGSGELGLKIAARELPQLVILDILLLNSDSTLNGREILKKLKKSPRLKAIPVLVITNLTSFADDLKKLGAADYLVKVDITETNLLQKVKAYT